MTKYSVEDTASYRKTLKKAIKQGKNYEKLKHVIRLLVNDEPLPAKLRDHVLVGNFRNCRECHIEPDWLLIYRKEDKRLILTLIATGSHSGLFGK